MKNIILIGMPGSGKTTIGERLAGELSANFFDCDMEIAKHEGITIPQIFERYGEEYFRNLESELLKNSLPQNGCVISTGGGIVERPENVSLLRANGTVVFVNRPIENILTDIDTTNRPLLKGSQDRLAALFDRRFEIYKNACHIEVENTKDLNNAVMQIINEVKKNG